MKNLLFISMWICLVASCGPTGKSRFTEQTSKDAAVRYAKGFVINREDGYDLVELPDPWNEGRMLQRYILVARDRDIPEKLPSGLIVRTPVRQAAVYTSVHAAMIDELQRTDCIAGVCEPQFMAISKIKEGLAAGAIADLGTSTAPNVERMLDIDVDCIIATPFQNADYGAAGKTGIPIVEGSDYMESTPLGRAEWILFFGLLFDRYELADSLFRATELRYLELKTAAAALTPRPTVLTERRYGASWYIPAGDSYISNFIRDAGGANIFDYISGTGSSPLSFETVLDRAIDADLWILKYNAPRNMTYADLRSEYSPYEMFTAFKRRRVYGCNTGKTLYYEESPLHPDFLLEDFIHIFHPELNPDYSPRYYCPLSRPKKSLQIKQSS